MRVTRDDGGLTAWPKLGERGSNQWSCWESVKNGAHVAKNRDLLTGRATYITTNRKTGRQIAFRSPSQLTVIVTRTRSG
jgi:hypothetical protein